MISKREQNKRDTNDRLLSAARILFSAQGFASTTVDDIAERAEVSRATFFNYFQGKDSVLEALHSGSSRSACGTGGSAHGIADADF